MPLADKYRPKTIDEVVGQSHIVGKDKLINNMIDNNNFPNMIFFGPPGTGKTTVAEIISKNANKSFYKINASNSSLEDVKRVISKIGTMEAQSGLILYIDEIQSFNKKQQQSILEFIENGEITLIASTTENPYYFVYNAILSRSVVIEFKHLKADDIVIGLRNLLHKINETSVTETIVEDSALYKIASASGGDLRSAINILELSLNNAKLNKDGKLFISIESIEKMKLSTNYNFDRDGDNHYNLLSAFQKSIRGSDPDASIYYLARLIKGGDLESICRRLQVIACEDIGLAYPNAITIVRSCVEAALYLGLPEARIPLSQATILLATSPKSNSSYIAINRAISDLDTEVHDDIPIYLKDSTSKISLSDQENIPYKYPHNYENHYVEQTYMPNNLIGRVYFDPQNNKFENSISDFLKKLKKK